MTPLRIILALLCAAATLTGCDIRVEPPTDRSAGRSADGPVDAGAARSKLEQLTVANAASMRGYSRARFPHWSRTGDNCNVRDTVLSRDGEDVRTSGCNVVDGRWFSVYDERTLTEPTEVDIDHMVPLANAWRSGATQWDDERRAEFANDLDRPQLFAVSAASNRSKGDQDPSQWKPPHRGYWCRYADDWITVKSHWELTVTPAERSALLDMLETC